MTSYQRRLNQNLRSVNLQTVARHRMMLLGTRNLVLGTRRRNRRHILHSAYADRVEIQNRIADHVIRFRLLRQRHHHATMTDDSNLLARNLSDGVAEKLLMIE